MKTPTLRTLSRSTDRAAPRPQRHWDARAATNFIAGGAGGGLLLCAAALATSATQAGLDAAASRTAILLALLLIAGGLTCVWFEIGRPWRALNVYRHVATSWMTREAMVALALFAAAGLAWLTLHPLLVLLAGLLGLAFTYSQARILAANQGIPAWRHPHSVPLMIATGLAEGAGLLACITALAAAPGSASESASSLVLPLALIALLAVRAALWKRYLAGLSADGAPDGALKVLQALDRPLILLGHALPALLLVAALAGSPGRPALLLIAGLLIAASGGFLKFTLVCRAAYTQGLALAHLPVRGRGPAGPAAKPGWKTLPD